MTMLRETRRPAVLLIAAALFASSCEENAKPTLSPPGAAPSSAGKSSGPANSEENKSDEKKSDESAANSEPAAEKNPALLDPSKATEQAPDTFQAKFTTTKGDFVIEVTRE